MLGAPSAPPPVQTTAGISGTGKSPTFFGRLKPTISCARQEPEPQASSTIPTAGGAVAEKQKIKYAVAVEISSQHLCLDVFSPEGIVDSTGKSSIASASVEGDVFITSDQVKVSVAIEIAHQYCSSILFIKLKA
jgi:hypothetical protein